MNAAEDRLSELMDAATCALDPPISAILAEGERLGRSRRRRRRAAVATGTATVVLLAGAGVAVGLRVMHTTQYDADDAVPAVHRLSRAPTGPGAESGPEAAASPNSAGADASSAPEFATPSPTPTASEALVPINSAAAFYILKTRVPADWKYGTYELSTSNTSLLTVDVNDGSGLARIFVAIATTANSGMDPVDCSLQTPLLEGGGKRPTGALPASCAVQHYPDGDQVMAEVLKADPYGEYQYRIIANRADGVALEITAANGDWGNPATEVTRAVPPLTVAAWTQIALDPLWQLMVPVKMAKAAQ